MRVAIGEKGIREMYAYYLTTTTNPLGYEDYVKVCHAYNKQVMHQILHEAANFRLPYRLGYLRVKKIKMNYKYLKMDYGLYNKTGEKAYHLNEHSDDYKVRILWEKSKCVIKGKRAYSLTITREHKRELARIMKTPGGHKIYSEE